jgi:hypothetical protein
LRSRRTGLGFRFTVCDDAAGERVRLARPADTAHWGIPDRRSCSRIACRNRAAFGDAYRMLHRRIEVFAALPISALDSLTLQGKLATSAAWLAPPRKKKREWRSAAPRGCEFIGSAFLLATVVGSGIMAAKLAGGNGALALLCNTLPTAPFLWC